MLCEFSRSEIKLVGRLLVQQKPALAIELLTNYNPPPPPLHDISSIGFLYDLFCTANKLNKEEISQPYRECDQRRVFAGAIVSLYDPEAILFSRRIKDGVVKGIRIAMGQTWPSNISKLVREARVRQRVYPDFKQRMDDTLQLFRENKRQNKLYRAGGWFPGGESGFKEYMQAVQKNNKTAIA